MRPPVFDPTYFAFNDTNKKLDDVGYGK